MQRNHIEQIFDDYRMLAIIIYDEHRNEGIEFFTPHNFSQQLAVINRPSGYRIEAHIHKPVPRQVKFTQETIFIKYGRMRVNFYSEDKNYLASRELKKGDTILLVSGGHEFEILEDTQMIEVKQGPYAGNGDKERFRGIADGSS